MQKTCEGCNGTGWVTGGCSPTMVCPECGGNGRCPNCGGSGADYRENDNICRKCGGTGNCPTTITCTTCNGTGQVQERHGACQGTGYIWEP